ncbi:MAG: YbjQ family protein [Bacillota bacterium]|nr:YbjQ family protein [Bacillota bacterium]
MDHRLITTTFDIPGFKVVETYGLVRGITVRSRDLFSNIGASFRSLAGGKIGGYVKLCEESREEAYDELIMHAESLGANAIVGFRYDANEVMQGITEVLAYGTAVKVVPDKSE